jgi:hypothetical protein
MKPSKFTFGVVGGYGATGRVVVSELHKSSNDRILIGGRDLHKAKALAAEFDGRVSPLQVDVLDPRALDSFCSQCYIIVNCASPVMVLQDRVAQAAFRARVHYVDAANLLVVKERMLPHSGNIQNAGLSFVMSAGWFPGLSELLPVYTHSLARAKMDAVESLALYFGDTDEWSRNAFEEAAWLLRQLGFSRRGYFHHGEWVHAKMFHASQEIDLGDRIGCRRFYMFSNPELNQIGARLNDCTLFAYGCVPGLRTTVFSALIALLPLPDRFGGQLLRNAFRNNRLPVGGFAVVKAVGPSQRGRLVLTVQLIYERDRNYWINGLVPATVARMIADKSGVEAGVHFLADAVNPIAFMAELRKGGVECTEDLQIASEP